MAQESFATVAKRRLLGVTFIIVLAGLITLSIAIYNKAFVSTVDITLKADHTGNELVPESDVKVRGIIVGSVRSVSANGSGATVKLALDPSMAQYVRQNATAQILPKTLFGEQYVAISYPNDPGPPVKAGAVIPQDRSKGALETEKVLGDILPVLTAVQPAQLNATLTALAQALHNRGDKLGQVLVDFDQYLQTMNPHTKQLADDLGKLGRVSLEYNGLAPDIFATLQNLQTSAHTLIEQRAGLDNLLTTGNDASNVLSGFLTDNEQRLITITGQTDKVYALLDEYSPEFTCLFSGISDLYDRANDAIFNNRIHLGVTVENDSFRTQPYTTGQKPYLVTGYGPHCFGLPNNPQPTVNGRFQIPSEFTLLCDGAPLTPQGQKGASAAKVDEPGTRCKQPAASPASTTNRALNSAEENALVDTLIAGDLHTTPNKVPGAATLLAGPLLRGQQVVVK
jgi:phospholipid/cholesterol/gamma-HCH transport system substrate-binding protein